MAPNGGHCSGTLADFFWWPRHKTPKHMTTAKTCKVPKVRGSFGGSLEQGLSYFGVFFGVLPFRETTTHIHQQHAEMRYQNPPAVRVYIQVSLCRTQTRQSARPSPPESLILLVLGPWGSGAALQLWPKQHSLGLQLPEKWELDSIYPIVA